MSKGFTTIQFGVEADTVAIGRNGTIKCKGLSLYGGGSHISIYPITSRGGDGNCMVQVPMASIRVLISRLQEMTGVENGSND